MSDTQNQILVTDFTTQLNQEAQQMTSLFRGKILEEQVRGEIFEHQLLGAGNQKLVTSRLEKIALSDPQHQRRGALTKTFYDAIAIDNDDHLRSLVDLKSGYAKQMAMSAMRQLDKVVAEAAIGSILTGKLFTTTTTASTDGVQTVTAGSGLTYDKILEIKQAMNETGVGLYGEKMYIAITDVQEQTLLNELEVISGDYNRGESARTGKLPEVAGFEFVVFPSNPKTGASIINKSSTTRQCFAFSADGLKLGMLSDFNVRYDRVNDAVDAHQLVITSRYAALRTEGARVVQVNVTE